MLFKSFHATLSSAHLKPLPIFNCAKRIGKEALCSNKLEWISDYHNGVRGKQAKRISGREEFSFHANSKESICNGSRDG